MYISDYHSAIRMYVIHSEKKYDRIQILSFGYDGPNNHTIDLNEPYRAICTAISNIS